LLGAADVLLVDAKEVGHSTTGRLQRLIRIHPVIDLAWIRLGPWRELLARLFDGPAYRPFVTGVHAVEVRGKPGPRHLLAGWLASRLELPPPSVTLVDERHASIRIEAHHAGRVGRFWVKRADGDRMVEAGAEIEDGPSHREMLTLPDAALPWSLAHALTRLQRDRIYEGAVRAAAGLPE
jgi:glucose-6-phosphate dehydrogenase assembly protein OpcA